MPWPRTVLHCFYRGAQGQCPGSYQQWVKKPGLIECPALLLKAREPHQPGTDHDDHGLLTQADTVMAPCPKVLWRQAVRANQSLACLLLSICNCCRCDWVEATAAAGGAALQAPPSASSKKSAQIGHLAMATLAREREPERKRCCKYHWYKGS